MKKIFIVLVVSCFLLISNATMAVGSTTFSKISIKDLSTTTTIENTDISLVEEKITITEETDVAEPAEENEIADPQQDTAPTLGTINEKIVIQPGEQTIPGTLFGIANAGKPYQGQVGTPITFYSNGILQPGATYEWDFHDKFDSTPGFGTHPTHVYSEADTYWVTLTVTKANGETYMDMAPVYVGQANNYLVPYGGLSYGGEKNELITFDASLSKSTDPNAYPLKYRWDFGDGEVSQWSSNPKISHTYEKERVYQVILEIKDKFGKTRYDILHADIGCSFSSYKNFFINTDGVLDELVDILFDEAGSGWLICQWLKPYVYYRYNNGTDVVEDTIQITDFNDFPMDIDFNNDGTDDLHLGTLNLFNVYGATSSPFHNLPSLIQFNTDLADIRLQGCVADSDDLTVCLQITLPPIFEQLLNLEEPVIRIGFHSEAGKAKPNYFRITHVFRPYLLYSLFNGGGQNEQGMPSQGTYSTYGTTTYQYSNPVQQPLPLGYAENTGSTTMGSTTNQDETVQVIAQRSTILPQGTSGVYPEQEIIIMETGSHGLTGKSFSLIAIVSDGYDFVPSTTFAITFESMFNDPFILTHRKANVDTDVNLAGEDESSSITFSVTRKNSEGNSATLGVLISPVQKLGLHVNIDRVQNERQVELGVDNPPETVVVFFETENQGQQDGRYFYMKNIPSYIGLHWVPSFSDGYIELNRGPKENFEIGLCDDLKNPDTKLFVTDIPTNIALSWSILLEEIRSVTLSLSTTEPTGLLTFNGEFKDLTQPGQLIKFRATAQNEISAKFEWNIPEGYFALDKSDTAINFDFSLEQDDLSLNVKGDYMGAEGEGIKVNFNGLKGGILEVDTGKTIAVEINLEIPSKSITLNTVLDFEQDGNMILEWGAEGAYMNMDSEHSIIFTNFNFEAPKFQLYTYVVHLGTNAHLSLNKKSENLTFGGSSNIIVGDFDCKIGDWSAKLDDLATYGSFDISINPYDKYYKIKTSSYLELNNVDILYDDPNPSGQYETEFGLDAFEMSNTGTIWFNFKSTPSKFNLQGNNFLALSNLHFSIGTSIDFTISSFSISGSGQIYTELYTQQLIVYSNINFNWDIDLQTTNYGSWKVDGSFQGSGTMNIQEWTPGQSGQVAFSVISPLHHTLKITRNTNLIVDLGSLNLNSGSATIKWQRETTTNGYLDITNSGITGTLSLFNITFLGGTNPAEFIIGTISIQPGTLYVDWQTQTTVKILHINNALTTDINLIKLKWSGKTITLGDISLKPGQFKITYDTTNKVVTLNNGMNSFGPLCTYEDADRKVSVDLLNLVNDYSKTMTLKWFEDANNQIIGVYLDTDNTQLVDLINFTSIGFGSTITGRRIVLGGFKADDFKIFKNANDKLEITGKIYIANHVTFSRLVNYTTYQWEDLDITWDLTSSLKMIKFESDFDLTIRLLSFEISGVHITTDLDLTEYLEVKWKLAGGITEQKEFYFDTNGQDVASLSFTLLGPDNKGIEIVGGGVWAENFYVKWKLWPPQDIDVEWGGTIGYDSVTVYGTVDGVTWIEIWPFPSGSQHT